MKKFVFLSVLFFVLSEANAQIENIKIPGDSTIVINDAYAGILASSIFSNDNLSFSRCSNLRAAFKATYSPTKFLSFISTESYQIDENSKNLVINQFWLKLSVKSISFETGLMPALATESRPVPATANGQFETYTESTIPGLELGAKVKYNFNENKNYIGLGVSRRNNEPEYHLRYSSQLIKASVYYSEYNRKFGSCVALTTKRLYNITVYNQDQTLANLACYKLIPKKGIDWYCNSGYGFQEKKIIKFETGLLKNFSGSILKGLFGLSYNYELRSIKGYLFLHI